MMSPRLGRRDLLVYALAVVVDIGVVEWVEVVCW